MAGARGMTERTMQITLPLPDPLLTANKRLHWAARARHTKAQRLGAYLCAVDARYAAGAWAVQGDRLWEDCRVRVDVAIRPRPRMKRHDDTAIWEALKPILDGLQDAGVVADDKQFVVGSLVWSQARTGEIVLTLTAMV